MRQFIFAFLGIILYNISKVKGGDSMEIGRYRLKLRELIEEEKGLGQVLMDTKVLVKGNVYKMMVKCGKKGCKCEREGELHSAWRISRSHEGRTQSRCISKREMIEYRKLTNNYRRFRGARARLVKIHGEQIGLINDIERAKSKDIKKW